MKRVGNIYSKICSIENLEMADAVARIGKKKQHCIKRHDRNRESNIQKLHQLLASKTFNTSQYNTFKIYESKVRDVYSLPYYPDRIVQHATMIPLKKMFHNCFIADTYGNIEGRGPHSAAFKIKRTLRIHTDETRYCLKIDIKKFYPSVDHDILKSKLASKIKDPDALWLLNNVIDSAPGLPIGNYLSQYLSNFYLADFDRWIKETLKVKYYFRYVDDMVFLAPGKESLHSLFQDIKAYLAEHLKLEVKSNYQIFPVEKRGIDFLGYKFFHGYTLLRKSIKKRFARAVSRGASRQTLAAYSGWAKHCNSKNLMKKLTANG